ncbi:hypothetical protein MN608_07112 [Microdochium nivale]|nr:hypothetical protein MN608_07112 [Microdochium nivale]
MPEASLAPHDHHQAETSTVIGQHDAPGFIFQRAAVTRNLPKAVRNDSLPLPLFFFSPSSTIPTNAAFLCYKQSRLRHAQSLGLVSMLWNFPLEGSFAATRLPRATLLQHMRNSE